MKTEDTVLKNKRKEDKKRENEGGQELSNDNSCTYDGAVVLLIKFYRKFISPLKKPCCRFTPSCSQYALDAVREWGVFFGISLAIWRILRGYDPVPKNPLKKRK